MSCRTCVSPASGAIEKRGSSERRAGAEQAASGLIERHAVSRSAGHRRERGAQRREEGTGAAPEVSGGVRGRAWQQRAKG